MVGAERMRHVKDALRGGIGERFGGAALSLDGVARLLDVQRFEPAVFVETEAGNRIVAAIGRKQKPTIRREDDTPRAFEGVRCAVLAADRLERSGTWAAAQESLHLGQLAIRRQMIVDDG